MRHKRLVAFDFEKISREKTCILKGVIDNQKLNKTKKQGGFTHKKRQLRQRHIW